MSKGYSEKTINAFLMNDKNADIVRESGLSISTVNRYKADTEFQKILAKRREEYVRVAVSKMQGTIGKAVETVADILTDTEVAPQVRLNACQIILTQCQKWTETVDILERIKNLEESIKDNV